MTGHVAHTPAVRRKGKTLFTMMLSSRTSNRCFSHPVPTPTTPLQIFSQKEVCNMLIKAVIDLIKQEHTTGIKVYSLRNFFQRV